MPLLVAVVILVVALALALREAAQRAAPAAPRVATVSRRAAPTPPRVPTPAPVTTPVIPAAGIGRAFDRAPALAQSLIRSEWPRGEWERAAQIGECESGWRARAHNNIGEDSRGWYQINIGPGANTDLAHLDLFDPATNVRAAGIVWRRQGWRAWLNCARRNGIV